MLDDLNATADAMRADFGKLENRVSAVAALHGRGKPAAIKRPASARPHRPADDTASPAEVAQAVLDDAKQRADAIVDAARARGEALFDDAMERADEVNKAITTNVEQAKALITQAGQTSKDLVAGAVATVDSEIARLDRHHQALIDVERQAIQHPTAVPTDVARRLDLLERFAREYLGDANYHAFDGTPPAAMTYPAPPGGESMAP